MGPERLYILGIRVDDVTMDEALAHIAAFVADASFHHVVTVNPEFIMTARRDATFAAVLNRSSLAVPDGVGLLWAARWRGRPLRERVAGVDLVERICARAAQHGWGVFFLGAPPGVAEATASVLASRYPGLMVAGTYPGSPRPEDAEDILARLQAAQPRVVFVAYGAPQQDLWIERHRERLPPCTAMGVGGAFDFISGRRRRAPRWMQRVGLEWLYRLWQEPWRWRRMLALPRFVWAVITSRG